MVKNTEVENNLTVPNPEITEVIDKISGLILPVKDVIGSDYDRVIKLRLKLRTLIIRDESRYICPLCHVPVNIICHPKSRLFFFRHKPNDENCIIDTRGEMSEAEINARKYNGAKESKAHKQIKAIIANSLETDERFKNIKLEQVWKGQKLGEWKKPDVSAIFDDKIRIVFEIQLSTTFLRVIAERREFYLNEGGLLCWIFKEIKKEYPRIMQEDIFRNNNCNLFLASKETLQISEKQKQLFIECHWLEPVVENQKIVDTWKNEIVPFGKLTFDIEHQRIFFFDYDHEKQKLIQQLEEKKQELSQHSQQADREHFEQFCLSNNLYLCIDDVSKKLKYLSSKNNITFPNATFTTQKIIPLLKILYSAKHGRPIGYKFTTLIQVAHRVENGYKKYLKIFGWALRIYGREEQIKQEDSSGKWANKVEKFKPLMQSCDETYQHDDSFDKLISFLFHELAEIIKKL